MTAQETIDKLNDALSQLVKAYRQLQSENENLKKEIDTLNKIKADLEYKLSEYEDVSEIQSNKINSMLDLVQSVINTKEQSISITSQETNNNKGEFSFDLKIDEEIKQETPETSVQEDDSFLDKDEKFDIDRMESLIDRLKT